MQSWEQSVLIRMAERGCVQDGFVRQHVAIYHGWVNFSRWQFTILSSFIAFWLKFFWSSAASLGAALTLTELDDLVREILVSD